MYCDNAQIFITFVAGSLLKSRHGYIQEMGQGSRGKIL